MNQHTLVCLDAKWVPQLAQIGIVSPSLVPGDRRVLWMHALRIATAMISAVTHLATIEVSATCMMIVLERGEVELSVTRDSVLQMERKQLIHKVVVGPVRVLTLNALTRALLLKHGVMLGVQMESMIFSCVLLLTARADLKRFKQLLQHLLIYMVVLTPHQEQLVEALDFLKAFAIPHGRAPKRSAKISVAQKKAAIFSTPMCAVTVCFTKVANQHKAVNLMVGRELA